MTKTIKDTHVSGRQLKDMILGECLPSYRAKACESFVRWDRDGRDRRTASGKAALAIESHQVGDIVSCTAENHEQVTRIEADWQIEIDRFEKNKNCLSEAQLRNSKIRPYFH